MITLKSQDVHLKRLQALQKQDNSCYRPQSEYICTCLNKPNVQPQWGKYAPCLVVNIELIRKCLKYACGLQDHARSDSDVIFTFVKRWFQYRVVQNFHQETQDNICLKEKCER